MKKTLFALTCAVTVLAATTRAADDLVTRLATCQDSWRDWKGDPVASRKFAEAFNAAYAPKGNDGSWAPKSKQTLLGFNIVRVFPESVGMGVGFSVVIDASFDGARAAVEKSLGKKLKDCDTGDGMRNCGLEIAPQRTVMLMTGIDRQSKQTLVGCYYLYEK